MLPQPRTAHSGVSRIGAGIFPVCSTLALLWVGHEMPSPSVALAAAMIIGAFVLGFRAKT